MSFCKRGRFAARVQRVHGHAGGVRVQKVHRVLPAFSGRVQRVVVSPCRAMSLYAAAGGIRNFPLNQPALWAESIVRREAHER